MVGRNHHHHAQRGKQRQRHEFPGEQPAHGQVLPRIYQHHRNRQVGQQLQHVGHQVVHEHFVEYVCDSVHMGAHGDQRAYHQRELHQHVGDHLAVVLDQQIRDQNPADHHQQENLGGRRYQVSYRIHIHLNSVVSLQLATRGLMAVWSVPRAPASRSPTHAGSRRTARDTSPCPALSAPGWRKSAFRAG